MKSPVATTPGAALGASAATDATIHSIETTPFRLKFASAISLSDGVRETAEHVLVTVTTTDGVTGHAECIPRPALYGETVQTAVSLIESFVTPRLVGTRVTDLQLVAAKLGALAGNPAARSSVELAVFDALAKTLGVPAHRLLGGYASEAHCCAILAYGEPDAVVGEARSLQSRDGIRMFKLKVGENVERDAALAQALRAQLGKDVVLYADANGRFSPQEAADFLRRTADCRLWGFEEPTAASGLSARRRVARRSSTAVIGDETCSDPRAVAIEAGAGRSTAVSIKIARTAVVGSTRIREYCSSVGVPIAIGTQGDSAIGAVSAAAFAASSPATAGSPAEVLFYTGFEQNVVAELPEIRDGKLKLSERPGFDFEIDHAALEECAVR